MGVHQVMKIRLFIFYLEQKSKGTSDKNKPRAKYSVSLTFLPSGCLLISWYGRRVNECVDKVEREKTTIWMNMTKMTRTSTVCRSEFSQYICGVI